MLTFKFTLPTTATSRLPVTPSIFSDHNLVCLYIQYTYVYTPVLSCSDSPLYQPGQTVYPPLINYITLYIYSKIIGWEFAHLLIALLGALFADS